MTKRDYKKSENDRHLSQPTADKLRVAISFGRTWKMMRQSARHTYGSRVTVYIHWIVLLLELRGQNRQNMYDCWSDIICCWDYIAPCVAIHALTIRIAILGSRYDTHLAGPSIAIHRYIDASLRAYYTCATFCIKGTGGSWNTKKHEIKQFHFY